ncbi:class I SAM-dependent methyltransferase [Patescibacteria group bacterium]|nr:class I SAM-dependent methyltransferase [Patescibacteria group bacterium]MBU1448555.1 class I SAM-dependent methyltransferase [Patescibacteria group bacterium]MBU2613040.1 class I SAM-dependent methyltransferase [Patescibacteria group bacterium]
MRNDIDCAIDTALDEAYGFFPEADASAYRHARHLYRMALSELSRHFGSLHGKAILDVGAGRGILALAIHQLGGQVVALERYVFEHDVSAMFQEGDEKLLMELWQTKGVVPLIADISVLNDTLEPNAFDAVVSLEVIEHMKQPRILVDGALRVLKPGGLFVVTTPNYGRLHARLRLMFGKNPKIDLDTFYSLGETGFVGHWREYHPFELERMLELSGFKVNVIRTFADPFFDIRKNVSVYSIKQTVLNMFSYCIPKARFHLIAVGAKPNYGRS